MLLHNVMLLLLTYPFYPDAVGQSVMCRLSNVPNQPWRLDWRV